MSPRMLLGGAAVAAAVLLALAMLAGGGSLSSAGEAAAAATASGPTNTSRPTVSGTAREGETLTAANGDWSGAGALTYGYQWQRCDDKGANCNSIKGETNNTYKLVKDDVGQTVGVAVTATDSTGSSKAYSDAVGPVDSAAAPPKNTTPPSLSGTAREGETLTLDNGSWAGSTPMEFGYQLELCNVSGADCKALGEPATSNAFKLTSDYVGHTVRGRVFAKNAYGTEHLETNPTAVVVSLKSLQPASTAQPSIVGTARVGQTLSITNGSWAGPSPISFGYEWERCDGSAKNCVRIAGATSNRYTLTSADAGRAIVAGVVARNTYGSQTALSKPRLIASLVGAGGSMAVSAVVLPDRLVVSKVAFSPTVLAPGTHEFTGRFRVTDSAGHPVTGALVYAIALPYGRVANAPEVQTDTSGYATIPFHMLTDIGARRGYVVFFVRARKPGDLLLAGVSTRRLVQVATGR